MKAIKFRKFDEQGYFKGENTSERKYTLRNAMEHLRENGFEPMFDDGKKLQRVWTNGKGINAYIL